MKANGPLGAAAAGAAAAHRCGRAGALVETRLTGTVADGVVAPVGVVGPVGGVGVLGGVGGVGVVGTLTLGHEASAVPESAA